MRPKEFYYTNEKMAQDLLKLTPIEIGDTVLDAGSGKNKVFQKNCPVKCLECEIEDGCNFLNWEERIDWVIGNPPFSIGWKFLDKASQIANKGIAFLINNLAFNSWTPKRFQEFADKGFYLNKICVVSDKRWFGRYWFLIFTKKNNNFVSWKIKSY